MEIHSKLGKASISDLSIMQRSLLFAELASIAYCDKDEATRLAKQIGFTTVEFYDKHGAQAYRFLNTRDCVIACRGTEPTELNDIAADLRAAPVKSESVSRVHKGFKKEVDDLWPMIIDDVARLKKRTLWFCGHSLGAAMATIMASRCWYDDALMDPTGLYTYGSPRAGWRGFVKTLAVPHVRWVNNNDIVTTVPPAFLGYRHDGNEFYLNAYGQLRKLTAWQRIKDKCRGLWMGIKQGGIDSFSDHSMTNYVAHIANNQEKE